MGSQTPGTRSSATCHVYALCSAVSAEDVIFMHGSARSIGPVDILSAHAFRIIAHRFRMILEAWGIPPVESRASMV